MKLGIEEEFHTVDLATRRLVSSAPALLERLPVGQFTGEAYQTAVEIVTEPFTRLDDLRAELVDLRGTLVRAAAGLRLGVLACGTAPMMSMADVRLAPGDRYAALQEDYAEVGRTWVTCGLHVHAEVEDRDLAARAMAWVTPHLSTLLALSASSPFWSGRDTGYASWRQVMVERLPTAGPVGPVGSAREYDELIAGLGEVGIIRSERMFYSPLRLSCHVPTLELRICDAVADVEVSILIAALFRAITTFALGAIAAGEEPPAPRPMIARTALWRAARSGLEGDLIDPVASVAAPASEVVRRMVDEFEPQLREYDDFERVASTIEALLARGSAARRQRAAAAEGGVEAAVDRVLAETMACVPVSGTTPVPEMLDTAGVS